MAGKQNGRWIKGDIGKLTEGPEIILSPFAGGANPADGTGDYERFEGVVRKPRSLTFGGFVK